MSFFGADTDLSKMFSSRTLEKNEVLFKEGDTLGDAYIIKYGEIKLVKHKSQVDFVSAGEVVGIFNIFFDNKVRMFTAIALTKGEVFIIPEKYLRDILNKVDPFVKYCFRSFLPLLNRFSEQFDKKSSNNVQEKKMLEEENFKKMKMLK